PCGAHPVDAGNPACVRASHPATCNAMVSFRAGVEAGRKAPDSKPKAQVKPRISKFKTGIARPHGRGIWSLVFMGCLGLLACSFRGQAADTNAILNSWFAAQTNLQTWSADFTQTRTLKALTQPLVAVGRVWFAMPNRFRWELGSPPQTIALRNADEMLVIYPR